MIVYIATYPRSGNSLLQHMIRRNFRHLPSQVKAGVKSAEAALLWMQEQLDQFEGIELVAATAPVAGGPDATTSAKHLALYRFGDDPWRRTILPGPIEALTAEVREALAREPDIFFLKTHDMPFENYFEGERAVQIVRHPGAALWSYFRHQHDFVLSKSQSGLFAAPPPTLDNIIRGYVKFGSWSMYHKLWRDAGRQLGEQFLPFTFEALVADQVSVLERLSEWLQLPLLSREAIAFEDFNARFPGKDLRGASQGYERYYSARQLDLLWEEHGEVAAEYGYAAPDRTLACPDEQLRRLDILLATAWKRHRLVKARLKRAPPPK